MITTQKDEIPRTAQQKRLQTSLKIILQSGKLIMEMSEKLCYHKGDRPYKS